MAAAESSLQQAALGALRACDPDAKLAATHEAARAFRAGHLDADPDFDEVPPQQPGRPARPLLVAPRRLSQRGLGSDAGRAAFVHAIAHIEFNAIDLAWDAVCRFPRMPGAFHADWVAVADDEARHFAMLRGRLRELGHDYGDFDAHDGLWTMAQRTAGSCLARMALVPRVLEARGLDVTPAMIARLHAAGDVRTADILRVILEEEVAHVAAGSRWFAWCCAREGADPQRRFLELVAEHAGGSIRGPFNDAARREAGFSEAELAALVKLQAPAA